MQLDKCMNMDSKKQLYIISGCNGAGKTTASYTVLPDVLECKEFVNADEIARGLSPFNPESMAIEAGRLMLQRINELLKNQQNFLTKTVLQAVLLPTLSKLSLQTATQRATLLLQLHQTATAVKFRLQSVSRTINLQASL